MISPEHNDWEIINACCKPGGFGDGYLNGNATTMLSYDDGATNWLYVGTRRMEDESSRAPQAAELWRWNGEDNRPPYGVIDFYDWEQILIPGLDENNYAFGYHSICASDSMLFIGADNKKTGCEVWRYDSFSLVWDQINEDAFGSEGIHSCKYPDNCNVLSRAAIVHSIDGTNFLFVGTGSDPWKFTQSACQLWACELPDSKGGRR